MEIRYENHKIFENLKKEGKIAKKSRKKEEKIEKKKGSFPPFFFTIKIIDSTHWLQIITNKKTDLQNNISKKCQKNK